MKIAKRIGLLILLLACWKLSQTPVQADNACTQACEQNYAACVATADEARIQCDNQAEWNYMGCFMTANDDYYDCTGNCYAYPQNYWAPCSQCGPELTGDDQDCNEFYTDGMDSCSDTFALRIGDTTNGMNGPACGAIYNACVSSCPPPDATPTPTP